LGSIPEVAWAAIRTSGARPKFRATSSEVTTQAAAPSLIVEALPAVTVPFERKAGFNFASESSDESSRGPSSVSNINEAPLRWGISTAVISSLNLPVLTAAAALSCEPRAYSSCRWRVISYLSATTSPVSPMCQ
jgi:hypothetical protein